MCLEWAQKVTAFRFSRPTEVARGSARPAVRGPTGGLPETLPPQLQAGGRVGALTRPFGPDVHLVPNEATDAPGANRSAPIGQDIALQRFHPSTPGVVIGPFISPSGKGRHQPVIAPQR